MERPWARYRGSAQPCPPEGSAVHPIKHERDCLDARHIDIALANEAEWRRAVHIKLSFEPVDVLRPIGTAGSEQAGDDQWMLIINGAVLIDGVLIIYITRSDRSPRPDRHGHHAAAARNSAVAVGRLERRAMQACRRQDTRIPRPGPTRRPWCRWCARDSSAQPNGPCG